LWTPEAVFEWPAGRDVEAKRERRSAVAVERSLGGVAYATRLGAACACESVRFGNLTDERFAALLDWVEQKANDGLEAFSYIDASRVVRRVRLEAPSLEWQRNDRDLIAADLRILFLAETSYT
jgi:hypothetical protein